MASIHVVHLCSTIVPNQSDMTRNSVNGNSWSKPQIRDGDTSKYTPGVSVSGIMVGFHMRDKMPVEEVLSRASCTNPILMIDNNVVDLSGFIEHHPGGVAVLLANLGRDASADFQHVPAHSRGGVARKIVQLTVAEADFVSGSRQWGSFGNLLDHVRLMRNAFEVQSDSAREPISELVYVGQLYSQLVADHIRSFLDALSQMADIGTCPQAQKMLDQLFARALARVEYLVNKNDFPLACVIAQHMRKRCSTLLGNMLEIGVSAMGSLRSCPAVDGLPGHVQKMQSTLIEWISEEYARDNDG
ncbi:cytochrome b5-like heme/steroid binding domain-containing protein [Amycolatopsis speibonae]|uniref:Cytochrome b5-like heme/steroid binding domain-containing protein n=1 Tax=Amycolatopsis speibonae TaxID=1450224 RepID=A0ABV7PDM7_9PSEU